MKTTNHLTQITMIAAIAAAGFAMQSARAADQAVHVVTLPTVTVIGKKIPIVTLERVVVTGKRVAPTTLLAQRNQRNAPPV